IDSEAATFLRDFFMNSGIPAGILKLKVPATPEQRLRIQQQWSESYGRGPAGYSSSAMTASGYTGTSWHKVGVLTGDIDYEELGMGPDKLRLDSVWGITESRICAVFRVPAVVAQVRIGMQFSTYSNYEQA